MKYLRSVLLAFCTLIAASLKRLIFNLYPGSVVLQPSSKHYSRDHEALNKKQLKIYKLVKPVDNFNLLYIYPF